MTSSASTQPGSSTTVRIRQASAQDTGALASTLAAAFFDDPIFGYCYPDPQRRRALLEPWFEAVIASNLVHEQIYTTSDAVAGAVWMPPEAPDDEHLAERLAEISGEDAARLAGIFERMEASHPRRPHHYLFLLATRPEWQSKGLGSRLLQPVLARCDRDGVPAYLEATSESNRRPYLRHGFEPIGEIRLPDGPSMWPMWREPVPRVRPSRPARCGVA